MRALALSTSSTGRASPTATNVGHLVLGVHREPPVPKMPARHQRFELSQIERRDSVRRGGFQLGSGFTRPVRRCISRRDGFWCFGVLGFHAISLMTDTRMPAQWRAAGGGACPDVTRSCSDGAILSWIKIRFEQCAA